MLHSIKKHRPREFQIPLKYSSSLNYSFYAEGIPLEKVGRTYRFSIYRCCCCCTAVFLADFCVFVARVAHPSGKEKERGSEKET